MLANPTAQVIQIKTLTMDQYQKDVQVGFRLAKGVRYMVVE